MPGTPLSKEHADELRQKFSENSWNAKPALFLIETEEEYQEVMDRYDNRKKRDSNPLYAMRKNKIKINLDMGLDHFMELFRNNGRLAVQWLFQDPISPRSWELPTRYIMPYGHEAGKYIFEITRMDVEMFDSAGRALSLFLGWALKEHYEDTLERNRRWIAEGQPDLNQIRHTLKNSLTSNEITDLLDEFPDHESDVHEFIDRQNNGDFSVEDNIGTAKQRIGQAVFSKKVKKNYNYRCAITGISTPEFLVASHIVAWADEHTIRLDPANGVCLSVLVDKAFDKGYILIEDDYTIRVSPHVKLDEVLYNELAKYHDMTLQMPADCLPKKEYLERHREKFKHLYSATTQ